MPRYNTLTLLCALGVAKVVVAATPLRVETSRDAWISSFPTEQEGNNGGSAGMEDHLTDTIEADRGFGFPVRVGGVVGQGEFEVGVGALAVSGVEGDPDRLRRVDGRLGEAGTAGGERVVVGDESQRRALAHGLDADEVRRDFEAG